MKASELRNLTEEELKTKLTDFRSELMNMRFQGTASKLDNPMRILNLRRSIARIETIMNERAVQAEKVRA